MPVIELRPWGWPDPGRGEYPPPGHPITHDIEIDIMCLKASVAARGEGRTGVSGTIDIDIGGTFTDCYAQLGSEIAWCKTRTTGYDLSRGMWR